MSLLTGIADGAYSNQKLELPPTQNLWNGIQIQVFGATSNQMNRISRQTMIDSRRACYAVQSFDDAPYEQLHSEESDLTTSNHAAVPETTSESRISVAIDIAQAFLLVLIGLAFLILYKMFKGAIGLREKQFGATWVRFQKWSSLT